MNASSPAENLKIEVFESYEDTSRRAAALIVAELKRKPGLLLCASAGATPARTYALLGARYTRDPALFRKMRVLQIDEWGGLPANSPASCEADLRTKLLEPLHIRADHYFGFKTNAANPQAECTRVARWLAAHGPIDICILGLGSNGHVAMNEPGDDSIPHTHVAGLAKSSLRHPMLRKLKRKPRFGLTLGLADILRSRKILLLVSGTHKRAALRKLCLPRVSTRFPGSFLWLHPDALVLCDREAYGGRKEKD